MSEKPDLRLVPKRGRGGSAKGRTFRKVPRAEGDELRPRTIHLRDSDWEWAQQQKGGASRYFRRLIDDDRASKQGDLDLD